MNKINILALALSLMVLGACRKEKLPAETSSTSDPVFYVSAKINGLPVKINAGDNDYFMKSSLSQDANNIYVLRGDLEKKSCDNGCGYGLSVLFTDYTISPVGAVVKPDSVLRVGPYTMMNQSFWPTEQEVAFVPLLPMKGTTENYTWTVADGNNVLYTVNSYSFSQKLKLGTEYNVTLKFNDGQGACDTRVHSNKYRPGAPFRAWVNKSGSGQTYSFTAVTDKTGNYSYKWEFGDGQAAEGLNVEHSFGTEYDVYEVKLTVTNEKNESCVYFYQLNSGGSATCEANFRASFKTIDFSKVFKGVTFLLKDPSGKLYSSADAAQVAGTTVNVTEVSEYERNSNGQHTKKVKMSFNCDLRDGAGNTVTIRDCEAVMAVAY